MCMYWNALQKKCIGEQLMNKVCENLNLTEREFFGLTYVQNQVKVTNIILDLLFSCLVSM